MKTLIIWDEMDGEIEFVLLDGDYSHLNRVYCNAGKDEEKEEELYNLMYNEEGVFRHKVYAGFPPLEKDTKIIVAGFVP
jgi:hypothetical protein